MIVLYHGGKEHYRYPSPNLQKVCRKLVEKGADLVLCQHSHCIGCEEKYRNGTIVYGQGNFLFDASESEFWQTSLLVQVGNAFAISYLPLRKVGNQVRLADETEAEEILSAFRQRSQEIQMPGFVQEKYKQFADSYRDSYRLAFFGQGNSILFRVINKLSGYRFAGWLLNHWYGKKNMLVNQNFIECEAHRELFLAGIKSVS